MSQCPKCLGSVELTSQHYGTLFSCPHCSAVFFVGWDGQPESPVEHHNIEESEAAAVEEVAIQAAHEAIDEISNQTTSEALSDVVNTTAVEVSSDFNLVSEFTSPSPNQSLDPSPIPAQTHLSAQEAFKNINEQVNSNQSLQGPITYRLIIEGIDLNLHKQKIEEALTDGALNLNKEEILSKIFGGKLEIANLNPIKASIIVQRLQFSGLEIRWVQNVI